MIWRKALNKEIKAFEEEDFVAKSGNSKNDIKLKFDIVLYTIKYKIEQVEAKEKALNNQKK